VVVVLAVAAVLARVWSAPDAAPAPALEVQPLGTGDEGLALPKTPGSLRFAVIGDVGRGDAAQYDTAAEMARWRERFDFDFVLMLGDNMYGPDTPADYALRFERPYKPLLDAGVTFHAVLGNHDPPNQPEYVPFNMNGHRYYSFVKELGLLRAVAPTRVQFFAIDTVTLDDEQLTWLRRELSQSTADWKLCFYHHPLYTSGRYRLAAGRIRRALEPLFVRYGVDVGLSGHEHFYERLVPIQGVQYFTSGAGGALRVNDLREGPMTAAGFDADTHFLLVEITGNELYFQAISRTGRPIDAGRFERPADPAPPPSIRK
jgi:hypothetical protein